MTADLARLEEIFTAAVAKTDRSERAAYLDEACGGDADLRQRLEDLLAADADSATFLPLPKEGTTAIFTPVSERPGSVIGRYKLLEQIGEGGFGVVFMAEQEQPVRRRVALKIIKAGMDTRQVVARFEAERQALALMDHPNIARVFDGGATETGRPYFVMELVRGVPITEYCDEARLTTNERLALFQSVCGAIQHAHQKGIIHRDLKPSNVLVTMHDDKAVPKVIDFGVAKATQGRLTERTLFTEFRAMIGTPNYMSPEQAHMSGLDVDTRSDVYSLGVLLYELLTGTTPIDTKKMAHATYDDLRRLICEVEPPKPSARLSALTAEQRTTLARQRQCEPAQLAIGLRNELDWIVMKCLEKDRARRYESASALAADLQRYLANEPVEACRPTRAYRLKKFVRRNKVGVFAGSAVAVALVSGLGLATMGFVQARHQAGVTSRVTEYMQRMLFSADPESPKGPNYTVSELLDDFSGTIDTELAGDPEVEAALHATIGKAYAGLSESERALHHLSRAVELKRSVYGLHHESYADSLVDYAHGIFLSQLYSENFKSAKYDEGVAKASEALAIYRARGIVGQRVIHALSVLQLLYVKQANWTGVERIVHDAVAEAAKTPDVTYWEIPSISQGLVTATIGRGDLAQAEELARKTLDDDIAQRGRNSLKTAWAHRMYAEALAARKKYKEALHADEQSLEIMRRVLGPGHLYLEHPRSFIVNHLANASQAGVLSDVVSTVEELAKLELLFRENIHLPPHEPLRTFDPPMIAARGLSQFPALYMQLGDELATAGRATEAEAAREKARHLGKSLFIDLADKPEFLPIVYAVLIESANSENNDQTRRSIAGDLYQLAMKAQRAKDPNMAANALYVVALLQLQVGDEAGYRATCEALVKLPFDSLDGLVKSLPIWTPCLAPNAVDDPLEIVKRAEEFARLEGTQFGLYVWGAALYRGGEYELAVEKLKESIAAYANHPAAITDSINYPSLLLAMAEWKLGKSDDAQRLLAETLLKVEEEFQNPALAWYRQATLEILSKEAKELIGEHASQP